MSPDQRTKIPGLTVTKKVDRPEVKKYRDLGFVLIPVKKGKKCPKRKGWNKTNKMLPITENVMIQTGENSGLTIIDVDGGDGNKRPGIEFVQLIKEDYGIDLFEYPHVKSGGEGFHFYFSYTSRLTVSTDLFYKGQKYAVDIKSKGGGIIAPPSIHPNGNKYEWRKEIENRDDLKPVPEELIELFEKKKDNFDSNFGGGEIEEEDISDVMEEVNSKFGEGNFELRQTKGPVMFFNKIGDPYCPKCNRIHENENWLMVRKGLLGEYFWACIRNGKGPKGYGWEILFTNRLLEEEPPWGKWLSLLNENPIEFLSDKEQLEIATDEIVKLHGTAQNPKELAKRIFDFARNKLDQKKGGILTEVFQDMNNYLAVLHHENTMYILERDIDEKTKKVIWRRYSEKVYLSLRSAYKINLKRKNQNLVRLWLDSTEHVEFRETFFRPVEGNEYLPNGKNYFNDFTGFAISREDSREGDISAFLDHIFNCYAKGDKQVYDYILSYFAHMVQRPEVKLEKSIILKGPQGSGKGVLYSKIGEILGSKYYQVLTGASKLGDKFNSVLENKILIFVDEVYYAKDKDINSKLKRLITEKEIEIERKGKESNTKDNYATVCFATNEEKSVQIENSDRRFVFIETSNGMRDMTKEEIEKIWNVDPRCIASFLYNRDITEWNQYDSPKTEEYFEQKLLNLDAFDKTFFDICESGGFENYDISDDPWVMKDDLYNFYKYENKGNQSKVSFCLKYKKYFGEIIEMKRSTSEGRKRFMKLPSIEEIRGVLDKNLN